MIDYRILPEQKLIIICNWGETSVKEIEKLSLDLRSDPNFSHSYDVIIDNIDLLQPHSTDAIHDLSKPRIDTIIFTGRVAVIAPADINFGMSRMYAMLTETESSPKMNVFREIGSALKWFEREGVDIESVFFEIKREIT